MRSGVPAARILHPTHAYRRTWQERNKRPHGPAIDDRDDDDEGRVVLGEWPYVA